MLLGGKIGTKHTRSTPESMSARNRAQFWCVRVQTLVCIGTSSVLWHCTVRYHSDYRFAAAVRSHVSIESAQYFELCHDASQYPIQTSICAHTTQKADRGELHTVRSYSGAPMDYVLYSGSNLVCITSLPIWGICPTVVYQW